MHTIEVQPALLAKQNALKHSTESILEFPVSAA